MSKKRSLIKTVTWRVCASSITFIMVYLFTGKVIIASGAMVIEALVKMLAYYLHERAWERFDERRQDA